MTEQTSQTLAEIGPSFAQDGVYKIIANYRDNDPYNRGYWDTKRFCMRFKNFRLWMKPGDLQYKKQRFYDPRPVLAAACKISNKARPCALHANDAQHSHNLQRSIGHTQKLFNVKAVIA